MKNTTPAAVSSLAEHSRVAVEGKEIDMSEEQCIKQEQEQVSHKPGRVGTADKRWGSTTNSRRPTRYTRDASHAARRKFLVEIRKCKESGGFRI